MKLSNMMFKTYREDPVDAEIKSHKLLVRAGYIRKQAAGSYIFLPLGLKVLNNIANIVRQEMNKSGAIELLMPHLLPENVYESRLKNFGDEMFRLTDRTGRRMCLGPTHEEVFTAVAKDMVESYKNLPINIYQVQTKFRDEIRPRFGLQRAKEFLMKDAYSFDKDVAGLDVAYDKMRNAYKAVFERLGLSYVIVDADTGAMGGSGSSEFMVKNDAGEDEIVVCNCCDYAANMEKAVSAEQGNKAEDKLDLKVVDTPNQKTIEDVATFLNVSKSKMFKAVVYSCDFGLAVAFVRGDKELNETKLKNHLKTIKLELASADEMEQANLVAGFVGVTAKTDVKFVVDLGLKGMCNFVTGANKLDAHITNCNFSDITNKYDLVDIANVVKGDTCVKCGGALDIIRGIEVGHIFKLGTRYSETLNCTYKDELGKNQLMQMGCYGIGISRTLSAVVEQFSDEKGIIWPENITPYKFAVLTVNNKDADQVDMANKIYNSFEFDTVLFDDRKDSVGVKLKDAELIGIPYIVVAGRDAKDGKCELINRQTGDKKLITVEEVIKQFS